MTETAAHYDPLRELARQYCDGTLSAEQVAVLEQRLRDDPRAMDFFVLYMEIHSQLAWEVRARGEHGGEQREGATAAGVLPAPAISIHYPLTTAHSFVGGALFSYTIAAMILGMGLLIGAVTHVSPPEQIVSHAPTIHHPLPTIHTAVGQITGMADCQFAENSKTKAPRPKASVSSGDKFNLVSGVMEISYHAGAKVILQGPVTYEVESSAGGFLSVGKLTARVDSAKPQVASRKSEIPNPQSPIPNPSPSTIHYPLFTVRTPTATVTDLGTEFGVQVGKQGRTEVHVLQGAVEARAIDVRGGLLAPQRVSEGCAVEIVPKAEQFKAVAFAARSFVRTLRPPADSPSETAYINAVLSDKPLGYWPLNEPAGSRKIVDRSGNGIHGYTMNKVMVGEQGPLSNGSRAVGFDGNGYIDLGRRDQFAMPNDFTVEAWVWIGEVGSSSHVISALGGEQGQRSGWGLTARRLHPDRKVDAENPVVLDFGLFGISGFPFALPRGEVIEARWLHMAVVFDRSNTAHLYLNGEHRGAVATAVPAHVGPVWLQIGCAQLIDQDFWRGRLAHVAVYPRSLSGQQIQNHYNQRNAGGKEVPDKH
jgi:hypothetical protein